MSYQIQSIPISHHKTYISKDRATTHGADKYIQRVFLAVFSNTSCLCNILNLAVRDGRLWVFERLEVSDPWCQSIGGQLLHPGQQCHHYSPSATYGPFWDELRL